MARICGSLNLLVFIKISSFIKPEKILLLKPVICRGDYHPSSLLIVTGDAANPGQYIALEGNRRMTALKTLTNPSLAANLPTYERFKKLSADFLALGLNQAECVVLDRSEAQHWIKRKHYNAMGGRGALKWDAVATARSEKAEGRPPKWMIALDFINAHLGEIPGIFEGIESKTTTVERVLGSSHMSGVLGLAFDVRTNSVVVENGDAKAGAELLKDILSAMASKTFTETLVTSAKLQQDYLQNFAHKNVKNKAPATPRPSPAANPPSTTTTTLNPPGPHPTGPATPAQTPPGSTSGPASPPTTPPAPKSKPAKFRRHLADTGLRINNQALNKFYAELKKLNVETNPHISAAMVRIFLEKCTLVFHEDLGVPCRNTNGWRDHGVKLKDKVSAALHKIDPQKKNVQLVYVWEVANGVQGKLHTLDSLNQAIHDHISLPSARDIITVWDRYHPYLLEIFSALEKAGK
ncbi:hypothetical protein FOB27_06875 [Rhizobium pusense]|uniref:ParB/Sulfiredoxin domain-containing protein n=2 Tax=Agrobacterium pusense TaxID=648995 RepID=A0AA44EM14_9HYPH|nr:hypothetical protein [Agrobacterium pusense]NRF20838.1 hypothetical protein [Agrobacterium pusense]